MVTKHETYIFILVLTYTQSLDKRPHYRLIQLLCFIFSPSTFSIISRDQKWISSIQPLRRVKATSYVYVGVHRAAGYVLGIENRHIREGVVKINDVVCTVRSDRTTQRHCDYLFKPQWGYMCHLLEHSTHCILPRSILIRFGIILTTNAIITLLFYNKTMLYFLCNNN